VTIFDIFTNQLLNGIVLGSFYALVALGYTMVFGVVKLLNFAHGELYMVGGFAGFLLLSFLAPYLGPGWFGVAVSMVLAMIAVGFLGVVIERVAYAPMLSAPRLSILITALAVSLVLQNGMLTLTKGQYVPFGARRAIRVDQDRSRRMGSSVNAGRAVACFLGSALAAAAGTMAGAYYGSLWYFMGFLIGLKAFTAAVIGGIGSIPGAMLGGLILGLLESFGTQLPGVGSEWKDVFSFSVLILVLVFKPTGLLGKPEQERM